MKHNQNIQTKHQALSLTKLETLNTLLCLKIDIVSHPARMGGD